MQRLYILRAILYLSQVHFPTPAAHSTPIDLRLTFWTELNPDEIAALKDRRKSAAAGGGPPLSLSPQPRTWDIKAIRAEGGGGTVSKLTPFRLRCIQLDCGGAAE